MSTIPPGFMTLAGIGIVIVVCLQVIAWLIRRRYGDGRSKQESSTIIDGDRIFSDDRINELFYTHDKSEQSPSDKGETTRPCPSCGVENHGSFEICRACSASLSASGD